MILKRCRNVRNLAGIPTRAAFVIAVMTGVAEHTVGFPIISGISIPPVSPGSAGYISMDIPWQLPSAAFNNQAFYNNAIVLVFNPNELDITFANGVMSFTPPQSGGFYYDPVVVSATTVNENNFSGTANPVTQPTPNTHLGSKFNFVKWPTTGNGRYFADLIPDPYIGDVWTGFQYTPPYTWNWNGGKDVYGNNNPPTGQGNSKWAPTPYKCHDPYQIDLGNAENGSPPLEFNFWFSVFIFDGPDVANSEVIYEYQMQLTFSATQQGNEIKDIKFYIPEGGFKGDEGLPEPSTALLIGAGVIAFGLRRRRKPQTETTESPAA